MDNTKSSNAKPAQAQAKARVAPRRSDLPFKTASLDPHTSFAARIAAGASLSSASKTAKQSVRRVATYSTLSQRRGPSSATAPTNASRQRQGNVGQAGSSARQSSSTSPSGRRPTSEKSPARTPIRTSASSTTSTVNKDRPLPPLPLTPTRQQKHHQSLPPPGPLARRPFLPLNERPPTRSNAVVSSTSKKTPAAPFEPRRFHMHGQTYDNAMAPYRNKTDAACAQVEHPARPSSRMTERARIGPLTEAELAPSNSQPATKQPKQATAIQPQCRPQSSRIIASPEKKAAEEQERRQLLSKSLQVRKPELWSPKHSSPLRQSHPTPSSPRPNSGEVSPLTPPPRSPVSSFGPSKAKAPEKQATPVLVATKPVGPEEELLEWDIEVIKASRIRAHAEIYEKDEPLLGYDLEAIKQSAGWGDEQDEPLLEWDVEAIKASMTRTFKKPTTTAKCNKTGTAKKTVRFDIATLSSSSESLSKSSSSSSTIPSSTSSSSSSLSSSYKPNTNIRWDKDPRANRAADASSSTAIPMLIKALNLLPTQTKEKYGVVAIDTVVQKRPQITTSHHSGSDDDAGSECSFLAAEQYVEIDDTGDYMESWPESGYYFGNRDSMPTIDESPSLTQTHDQSVLTTSNRTSATSTTNTRSSMSEKSRWQAHQHQLSRRDTDSMF